jgi:hypothetical protein
MSDKKILLIPLAGLLLLAAAALPPPQMFLTSDRCISCHNGLVSPGGLDYSFGADWRSSMMANSSRDPYWQAAVRRETLVHAGASEAIQHECSACHMPMSRYTAKIRGEKGRVFANLPIGGSLAPGAPLAADGVSCAMCHQIREDKLGEKESFTAGFVVDTAKPLGEREIFGPYEIDGGRQALMRSSARFTPIEAAHVQSAELCASCHTLYTHALDENGSVVGELPEQVPYLEWKHSAYSGSRSCQSCHMPQVEGAVPVTGVVGQEREQVSRHVFRGGNFFMPRMLNAHRNDLGVGAQPQEMETTAQRSQQHLATSSARLSLENSGIEEGRLRTEIQIANLAGHKLPTAYPSRRAWLHIKVTDGSGNIIFESGRLNPDGSIAGNDNDMDKDRFEPHHAEITNGDQVQIYEGILAGPDGRVTTVLLTAVSYAKDNRLLPAGFEKQSAHEDIAVKGAACSDPDFLAGGDRVRCLAPLGNARGPYHIVVELWYQPIAFRWAKNLQQQSAAEIERFADYYSGMADRSGVILARAETTVE